jgi:hypothetical protein
MTALDILFNLRQQRRGAHIQPDFVPEIELLRALYSSPVESTKQQLNEAYQQGKIRLHRTINGRSVELID